MTNTIHAPWTDEQVDALNFYQASGVMHSFTCGGDVHTGDGHVDLIATPDGWVCPDPRCDYTQGWAHAFMADRPAIQAALDDLRGKGFNV